MPKLFKALTALICIHACSSAALAGDYVVGVATEPYMAQDMAKSVVTEAYRRLGHSIQFKPLPLLRSLREANSGAIDGDLLRGSPSYADYPNLKSVPLPIAYDEIVAYGIGQRIQLKTYTDLKPYRISFVRGIKSLEPLITEGFQTLLAEDGTQAFRQLAAGRVDFVLLTRGVKCRPKQLNILGVEIQEGSLEEISFYHHLNTQHSALLLQLTETLHAMQKDGSLKRLQDQARRRWLICDNVLAP